MLSRSHQAHIYLVLVTFVWGVTFVQIKDALADISPLLYNAVRMSLASAVMMAALWPHLRHASREAFVAGVVPGIFLWLGYEFQTVGLVYTTPSKSAFLTGMSVVLVPVFLAATFHRHIHRWTVVGVSLAFVGLFLLTVPAGEQTLAEWGSINRGDLLTIACAVVFAWQIIFLGRATQKHAFQAVAVMQLTVAALAMIVTVPLVEDANVVWSPRVLWAIAVTGVLGTAVAFTVQAWAQQFTPPTHTALIFALEPVFAWMASAYFLGERLGWRAAIGAALILAGVLVSELKGSSQAPPAAELGP